MHLEKEGVWSRCSRCVWSRCTRLSELQTESAKKERGRERERERETERKTERVGRKREKLHVRARARDNFLSLS